jgi:hypothetical protein
MTGSPVLIAGRRPDKCGGRHTKDDFAKRNPHQPLSLMEDAGTEALNENRAFCDAHHGGTRKLWLACISNGQLTEGIYDRFVSARKFRRH